MSLFFVPLLSCTLSFPAHTSPPFSPQFYLIQSPSELDWQDESRIIFQMHVQSMIMNKHLSTCLLYSPPRSVFSFFLSLSLPVCCLWQAADLTIERNPVLKPRPDPSTLVFGKQFSDHMLTVSWSEAGGWEAPQIKPFQNLSLHPASSALHYSIEVKECVSRMAHGIFFSFIQNTIDFISPSLVFSPSLNSIRCSATTNCENRN